MQSGDTLGTLVHILLLFQMQLVANSLNVGVADRRLKLLLQGRHTQYTVLLHGACR